jgi:hypothetical protein
VARLSSALSLLLIAAGFGTAIAGEPTQSLTPCRATPADLQSLRDNLQIVRNQVLAARNEFGPERQWAAEAAEGAVRAFEEAAGHALAPSPGSDLVTTPRSGTKHPHMQVAKQAFGAAQHAFEAARCALPGPAEPLQKAMANLDRLLQFR